MIGLLAFLLGFAGLAQAGTAAHPRAPGAVFRVPLAALPDTLNRLLREARNLRSFHTGPRHAPRLTVFFDPNCPFCARFWQSLWPRHREYRIRWIPVAYVRPDSARVAASILLANAPQAALVQNEEHFDYSNHRGGVMPAYRVPPELDRAIAKNTQFWRHWFGMLPVFFFRSATGTHLFVGRPSPAQWRAIRQHALASR